MYDLTQEQERRYFVDVRTIPNGIVIQTPVHVITRETITRNPLDMV